MKIRGWSFFQVWALLLILTALLLGSLSIFTFGVVCFAGLFGLWLKAWKKAWPDPLYLVHGIMLLACVLWFIVNILIEFFPYPPVFTLLFLLAFLFPALILNLHYLENRNFLTRRMAWKGLLALLYVTGVGGGVFIFSLVTGWLQVETSSDLNIVFMVSLSVLFGVSGTGSAIILTRTPGKGSRKHRESRRVNIFLLVSMVLLFAAIVLVRPGEAADLTSFLSVVSRSLPLIFLFVNSYYENRFDFYDVFVKRATLYFVVLVGLIGYFALLAPWLTSEREIEPALLPWVHALILLPLVMSIPWLYRKLGEWLDEYWLGRQYSPVEAVKFFLEGVQKATTREELAGTGGMIISTVFRAPVAIELGPGRAEPDFEVVQRVKISSHGRAEGEVLLGPRPNQTPYFASDLTLVTALAEVLSFLLQNQWLQQKKQEQEKREQALILDASRSELKALRAQINPHFLFNALNAIASLTQRDPDRAEQTVEQLAEVFRYTLSRSEQEWVRISDEFEFIRCYLEIEKARFGERLRVALRLEPGLEELTIPTMLIQTLVENAVKHGVSRVRGVARIEVDAVRADGWLKLRVVDNGPEGDSREEGNFSRGGRSGYGLKNIRERLSGYFGEGATLGLRRDEEEGLTVAEIRLPLVAGKEGLRVAGWGRLREGRSER